MSAFEFLFSFYCLLLGLSVAILATGAARAFKHRKAQPVGWLTPLHACDGHHAAAIQIIA